MRYMDNHFNLVSFLLSTKCKIIIILICIEWAALQVHKIALGINNLLYIMLISTYILNFCPYKFLAVNSP